MGIAFVVVIAALAIVSILLVLAVARTKKVTRRFEALEDIAMVSDRQASIEDTLVAISQVLVPGVADYCSIDAVADGEARRAAVRVAPGAPAGVERSLAEREPLPSGEEEHAFLRGVGIGSAITVPLRARGEATGALTLGVAWSRRRFRPGDVRFAHVLSGRVALALDNAGLFSDLDRSERARAEIAETLQRGLLPPPLPHIPGWSAAAMYRPAGAENEVGGDFYDAFPVAAGWMIVIGDVTGRGAQAASIAAQARYTLHTAAVLTGDPLMALATLNRALLARRDSALCSVAALSLSEDPLQPVRLAVAGHPPPLLVDRQAVTETVASGPLLGAFPDAEWTLDLAPVLPGQQLVVITDGITEASGAEGRFGEARLHAELAGATSPVLAVQRLEGALHDFTEGVLDDDAAMLAIARATGAGAEDADPALDAMQPLAAA